MLAAATFLASGAGRLVSLGLLVWSAAPAQAVPFDASAGAPSQTGAHDFCYSLRSSNRLKRARRRSQHCTAPIHRRSVFPKIGVPR